MYYRKAQGALEYLIILSVIILVALAVLMNLPAITSLTSISATNEARLNDIQNIISDVALQTTINADGNVQASMMTMKYRQLTNAALIITNEQGINCTINIGIINVEWTTNSTNCPYINGTSGQAYTYRCNIKYTNPEIDINYSKSGVCKGLYEEI